jgi:hypothetical protein
MFKIVTNNKKQSIVNSDQQVIYTPPPYVDYRKYDLNKLLNVMIKKGYRDIEDIMAFESGKLR